jgi:signal-transduction protein with cAMP-binding, CBS, and nucleotidyltransferase domain
MQGYFLKFPKDAVICREGDPSTDLFFLKKGKLLVCTVNGTQVKAIAHITAGQFIGELSFFDGRPRQSSVIALEPCRVIQIPRSEMGPLLPTWYMNVGNSLTKKIRLLDNIIHDSNIRRSTLAESKPLSIEEQRAVLEILSK